MALLDRLFRFALQENLTDLFLVAGEPPLFRRRNEVAWSSGEPELDELTLANVLREFTPDSEWTRFERRGQATFAFDVPDVGRFRANLHRDERGSGVSFRVLPPDLPDLESLGHSELVQQLCRLDSGLILVTGPAASGRTTTALAMAADIHRRVARRIVTLEDHVEYRLGDGEGVVTQLSAERPGQPLAARLEAANRLGCDLLIVDELSFGPDLEAVLRFAERGPLVIAVTRGLDTISVLERALSCGAEERRPDQRRRLASTLRAVINQRLVPTADESGQALALELLLCSQQVGANILEDRLDQIPLTMRNASRLGMVGLNTSLMRLLGEQRIEPRHAWHAAVEKDALVEGFRRAGVPFSPPRFAELQTVNAAHRNLTAVRLGRSAQILPSDVLAEAPGSTEASTIIPRSAEDVGPDRADGSDFEVVEPALLELGRVVNASARARLLLQHPDRHETIIELFGGSGILFGRNPLDRQRGLRNDWLCQALPEDDHEARAATRRISRIHGGFRVPDDGGWQVAAWGEAGMAIDDRRLPRGQWLKLPAQSFTLDIADDAVSLDCQAFRAQSLVLKRPASESIWYVVLRHRVDFALTTAGFDVATGLSGTQFGFGVVYADGEFRLIPGMAGNVTSGGKPVDSHRRLEAGMSIEVGRFSLVFQPLMVRDIAR